MAGYGTAAGQKKSRSFKLRKNPQQFYYIKGTSFFHTQILQAFGEKFKQAANCKAAGSVVFFRYTKEMKKERKKEIFLMYGRRLNPMRSPDIHQNEPSIEG